ncbi:MAG: hypothetical protein SF029_16615 [bacterium]|nr:hypothetical protein [bacterium]
MESLRRTLDGRAVLIAGLVAGTVFLLALLLLLPALEEVQGTLVLRYIGSLLLGPDSLTQTDATGLIVGVVVHYALSVLFTLIIAIVVHRWGLLVGVIGGAILGLAFYLFNLYTLTAVFEWFFAINSTPLLISHVLFGAVAGGVYELFDHYDAGLSTTSTDSFSAATRPGAGS